VWNSKGHEATGTKTFLVEERFENGVVDDNKRTASEPASQPASTPTASSTCKHKQPSRRTAAFSNHHTSIPYVLDPHSKSTSPYTRVPAPLHPAQSNLIYPIPSQSTLLHSTRRIHPSARASILPLPCPPPCLRPHTWVSLPFLKQ
jgi:hypothetical protein